MKRKPNPDHKLARYSVGVSTTCSCGWVSSTWYGKGGRQNALREWLSHRDKAECSA